MTWKYVWTVGKHVGISDDIDFEISILDDFGISILDMTNGRQYVLVSRFHEHGIIA